MNLTAFLSDFNIFSLLLCIFVTFLIYCYSTRKFNYWARRGIPFAKPYPFVGSIHGAFSKKNMDIMEVERYKKLGKIYGHFEGNKPLLTIADPDILKKIFVKDFNYFSNRRILKTGDDVHDSMLTLARGEDWKRIRSIVTPTFTTGKIKRMMSIFEDCTKTLIQNFRPAADKMESIDVLKYYSAFTMDVIASSAFSTKIDSHNDPENEFVRMAKATVEHKIGLRILLWVIMPKVLKMLNIQPFDMHNINFFKEITSQIIDERERTGQKRNDFLQLLLDTAAEESIEEKSVHKSEDILSNYGDDPTNHSMFKIAPSKSLSMNELVGQCVIFFLAGYHTTATTLALATYLLAMHPDVQDRVFEEIKETLVEAKGELDYDAVQKMKYLDNVIAEVLRMYPPLMRVERTAEADYELKELGITIPKGMLVGIPVYAMHRDPELFPNPEKFDPERFSAEGKARQIPYTYLPFGAGPRNCVAMRFALQEIKMCLIYVISTFSVERCPDTKVPVEFKKTFGLIKPKPIKLSLVSRTNNPLSV